MLHSVYFCRCVLECGGLGLWCMNISVKIKNYKHRLKVGDLAFYEIGRKSIHGESEPFA